MAVVAVVAIATAAGSAAVMAVEQEALAIVPPQGQLVHKALL